MRLSTTEIHRNLKKCKKENSKQKKKNKDEKRKRKKREKDLFWNLQDNHDEHSNGNHPILIMLNKRKGAEKNL
jgi:hypothetical protein